MAVYTEVSEAEARTLLRQLGLGELLSLRGIAGGIENTNYFATVHAEIDVESGYRMGPVDYVLTLFERLRADQLPFYLYLMQHLAAHGLPVPNPAADHSGNVLHSLRGKPAAVVNRLPGRSEMAPQKAHAAAVGAMHGSHASRRPGLPLLPA